MPSTPLPFTVRERQFVYSVALKYMRSRESAEEVTQDALITAYRHRDQFRGDSKATTWLYRVAATTALMQLRKRTPPSESLDAVSDSRVVDGAATPEEAASQAEAVASYEHHLGKLDKHTSEIFQLHFVEGYSDREIAERLNLKVSTVRTRAHRARHYLRRALTAA